MTGARDVIDEPIRIELRVPPLASSVSAARSAISAIAKECGERVAQDLELICSELVTNAVLYGRATRRGFIEIDVRIDANGVSGSVTDAGGGFDPTAERTPRQDGGYGLVIVERLSRRWGVARSGDSTTVWFEL